MWRHCKDASAEAGGLPPFAAIGRNVGFVNVGTDHDMGAFAVASIRGWWRAEGRRLYLRAGVV